MTSHQYPGVSMDQNSYLFWTVFSLINLELASESQTCLALVLEAAANTKFSSNPGKKSDDMPEKWRGGA